MKNNIIYTHNDSCGFVFCYDERAEKLSRSKEAFIYETMLSTEGTLRVLNQTKPELNTTLENALTRSSVTAILFTIQNAKQSLIKIRIRKKNLRVVGSGDKQLN